MDTYTDEIDLREYIEVLWRWKFFVVGITLIAALTAALVSFLRAGSGLPGICADHCPTDSGAI
ncbi:MAG: Wzz/FepE/Etk N-terminal domain-containing protein [Bacillota bacterium]